MVFYGAGVGAFVSAILVAFKDSSVAVRSGVIVNVLVGRGVFVIVGVFVTVGVFVGVLVRVGVLVKVLTKTLVAVKGTVEEGFNVLVTTPPSCLDCGVQVTGKESCVDVGVGRSSNAGSVGGGSGFSDVCGSSKTRATQIPITAVMRRRKIVMKSQVDIFIAYSLSAIIISAERPKETLLQTGGKSCVNILNDNGVLVLHQTG